MTWLYDMLSTEAFQQIGWTIFHSLWQLAVIGVLVGMLLAVMRRRSPRLRYAVACAGLVLMALCPAITVALVRVQVHVAQATETSEAITKVPVSEPLRQAEPAIEVTLESSRTSVPAEPAFPQAEEVLSRRTPPELEASTKPTDVEASPPDTPEDDSEVAVAATTSPFSLDGFVDRLSQWTTLAAMIWIVGLLIMGTRQAGGWWLTRRLASSGASAVSPWLTERAEDIARRMGIRNGVRIFGSWAAKTPMVIGCWRPVILVPAALVSGLAVAQLEAILAHELAHVRRYDPLVNILQSVLETLLYYHPAVWWLSRRVRMEREFCCDDLAMGYTGDELEYAEALARVAAFGAAPMQAVAASGQGERSLLHRVRRVLGMENPVRTATRSVLSALLAGLLLVVLVGTVVFCSTGADEAIADDGPEANEEVASEETEELPAPPPGSIRIVDVDGEPITGAKVTFSHEERESATEAHHNELRFESDDDGLVDVGDALQRAIRGRGIMTISAEGFYPRGSQDPLSIATGAEGRVVPDTIQYKRPVKVSGHVLGPDGRPLAGAPLSMTTSVDGTYTANHLRAISDEDGNFEFEDAPPGELIIYYPWDGPNVGEINSGKWRKWTKPGDTAPAPPVAGKTWIRVLQADDGEAIDDLGVDLSKSTCGITGQVVDAEGNPVSGATVQASWPRTGGGYTVDQSGASSTTVTGGRFSLTGLPPVDVRFIASVERNTDSGRETIRGSSELLVTPREDIGLGFTQVVLEEVVADPDEEQSKLIQALKAARKASAYTHTLDADGKIIDIYLGGDTTPELLAMIGNQRSLKRLNVETADLADDDLKAISELTQLEYLSLYETGITDRAMPHLSKLTNLEEIVLHGNTITDAGLMHLVDMPRLRSLSISNTSSVDSEMQTSDDGMEHIAKLKGLEILDLLNTDVTAQGLRRLTELPELKTMVLGGGAIDDNAAVPLSQMDGLRVLELRYTAMEDDAIAELLEDGPPLERLSLSSHYATDKTLEAIGEKDNFTSLELRCSKFTDDGLAHLAKLKGLTRIDLTGVSGHPMTTSNQFTHEGLAHLKSLPNLNELWLNGIAIRPQEVGVLCEMKQLKHLHFMPGIPTEYEELLNRLLPNTRISSFHGGFGGSKFAPGGAQREMPIIPVPLDHLMP